LRNGEDLIFQSSLSSKSKSHSFVEFSSRANSNVEMCNPTMILPKQKEKYIKQSNKEEEKEKNSESFS